VKILVVDDEQLVRWFLERALRKWGHSVVLASTANEASERMAQERFDMLITDLRMPEGSGDTLLKTVGDASDKPSHIVVCSAFVTADMSLEFQRRGILILKKPFKLGELEDILHLCSNSETPHS
jgi:two-component system response regulator PilR (NtrC family)